MSNTVKITLAILVLGLGILGAWRFRKTPEPVAPGRGEADVGLILRGPGGPGWTAEPRRAVAEPRSGRQVPPPSPPAPDAPPPVPPMPVPRFPMMGPVIHRKPWADGAGREAPNPCYGSQPPSHGPADDGWRSIGE